LNSNEFLKMQYFEYFSRKALDQIHAGSLQVLEKVGMDFLYEPATKLLSRAGCKVDGRRVYFPPKLVEEQIAKAPSEFTLFARNPAKNIVIGGDHTAYVPCYGAPVVSSLDEGRRESTLEDFTNFVKLTQASLYQDITGGIMAEPNDIPLDRRTVEMVYAAIRYSDKPFMGGSLGAEAADDTIAAASIVFGGIEELANRPPFVSILTSLSPLAYDDRMLSAMMTYARAGLPQLISSLAIAGATGPVTMEGTLVVQNAEVLAGITLIQLVREGAPVIYGGQSTGSAMRYGTLSIGAPEMAVNTAATAQMARFYRLPSRSGGTLTDSKICDSQAGSESMMNQLMAALSGINFVLHSAGILETYLVASYEKFILDDEICGMCKRILRGEYASDERLALDLIGRVGPGGEYLTNTHTFQNFRKELYQPIIEERSNFGNWVKSGAQPMENRANAKWKEILANYIEPELPKDLERDLRNFVDRK
jgi:trimethylamine--corrinoid protein Co-methyltransferase